MANTAPPTDLATAIAAIVALQQRAGQDESQGSAALSGALGRIGRLEGLAAAQASLVATLVKRLGADEPAAAALLAETKHVEALLAALTAEVGVDESKMISR